MRLRMFSSLVAAHIQKKLCAGPQCEAKACELFDFSGQTETTSLLPAQDGGTVSGCW